MSREVITREGVVRACFVSLEGTTSNQWYLDCNPIFLYIALVIAPYKIMLLGYGSSQTSLRHNTPVSVCLSVCVSLDD